jgi:hypothetical protein
VPPTPAKAMTRSRGMAHGPSFRPARPQSREKQTPPVRSRATKPCTHCGGGGGRIVRRQWSGHRRRRAKTGMPCMKLPGRRLSARDFARQVAELEVRVAVLNGLTAPADPSPTWRHKSAQERERHKPQTTRATEPGRFRKDDPCCLFVLWLTDGDLSSSTRPRVPSKRSSHEPCSGPNVGQPVSGSRPEPGVRVCSPGGGSSG